jgi:hypothetical protein
MSKLFRSLLWSGVVAAGVAACGDDVTVTPPPNDQVHSVSVAPTGITIAAGTSQQMVASVNADAGVTNLAVNWTINVPATFASISATGNLTTVAGQVGAIVVQACAQANTSVCGNATINVALTAPGSPTVTQVNVSPASAIMFKPVGAASSTQQLSAAVIGTNSPSQSVNWTIVGAPLTGVSVSTAGLVTLLSTVTVSSFNVSACSTVAGFTNICGFAAIAVSTAIPATISGQTVTHVPAAGAPADCTPTGAGSIPVTLTDVNCQIEVTATVNAGDIILARMDVVMTNTCSPTAPTNSALNCNATGNTQVMASHTFPGTVATQEGDEAKVSAPSTISLSIDTRMLRSPTNVVTNLVPAIFNGNAELRLILYTPDGAQVFATSPTPVVMSNADAVIYPTSLASTNDTPAGGFFNSGNGITFWTGSQTVSGGQYIAYSQVVPTTGGFFGSLCGTSSSVVSGTPSTGIQLGGVFACAGVEGENTVTGLAGLGYPVATGPDGTAIVEPEVFTTVASAFQMPTSPPPTATTENRWNPVTNCSVELGAGASLKAGLSASACVPLTLLPAVGVDNKAPTITPNEIGFLAGCSATIPTPGCWVNGVYNILADFPASETASGSGVATVVVTNWVSTSVTGVVTCGTTSYLPADLAEQTSPLAYDACATATDNVGNVSTARGFNVFGVDKTPPTITYAIDPLLAPAVLYAPLPTTLDQELRDTVPGDRFLDWKVNDNNAGLDTATALQISTAGTTLNGSCSISINGALNAEPAPGADRFMIPANAPAPDAGCGDPGYYYYLATVTDRAGNSTSDAQHRFGFEPGDVTIVAIAPTLLYGGGDPATITVFASHTGASLSAAKMGIWYTSNAPVATPTPVQLIFDLGQIFNAPFQVPLFLTTPLAGTPMTVAASSVLAGIVIDSTEAPVSAFDSVTAIVRDVYDASGFTSATPLTLIHADTASLVIPPAFIDPAKVSTDPFVWENPQIGAATFSGSGACTFTYATPTNGPTIPTSVLVTRTILTNIYDVLFELTSAPTLISDNGTTRIYRYSVAPGTCASLALTGTLRLIAVKDDSDGLPVGYLVP